MLSSSKADQGISRERPIYGHRVSSCQPRGRASQENWPEAWVYPIPGEREAWVYIVQLVGNEFSFLPQATSNEAKRSKKR